MTIDSKLVSYQETGLTLVELMLTVAVASILIVLSVPSLTAVTEGNQLKSTSDKILSSLNMARFEAIRRNHSVSLCGTADQMNCISSKSSPWLGFLIQTKNRQGVSETLWSESFSQGLTVTASTRELVFDATGFAYDVGGKTASADMKLQSSSGMKASVCLYKGIRIFVVTGSDCPED